MDNHPRTHLFVDDRFLGGARFLIHDIRITFFSAKRERWGAIRDQVEPQELNRRKRSKHFTGHVGEEQPAKESGQKDDDNLCHVARNQVIDELTDVGVNDAPLLHCRDNADIVVIREHHVSGIFGNIRARDPHGNANVCLLDGGSVVDTVAGHRHNFSIGLQCIDNANLVFRGDAREYIRLFDFNNQLLVVNFIQLGAGEHLMPWTKKTNALGNSPGCVRVVASDHQRTNAGFGGCQQGRFHFRPGRVDHADETGKDQVLFHILAVTFVGFVRYQAVSHTQNTQSSLCQFIISLGDGSACFFC